jgi:DNA-binding MarR family transcriptional regulator
MKNKNIPANLCQKKQVGRNISIIFRATKARIQECHNHQEFKLSMAQMPVLSFLIDEDDNFVSQDFITKSLGIDKASTTRAIQVLCKAGYVYRERDKRDKRAYNLSLTEEGKNLKNEIMIVMKEWTDIIYDGISDEELKLVEKITNKISDNIKKYKEEKKYENN